ncbi:MAG: CO dehydrogenase/CO-methylating acetyl-CoA synthase complex subunit beta, partial [Candidatus Omnitrophica bacterium]|nr:CO dehydrogenase/CO-methylating acetyl-CoA synthase complex subunit beta [Candidatus Omnitrophota bacterium]
PTGICTYEHLVKERDYKKIVPRCIEVRGVKVKISEIPIPVSYSAAFEGERVRREQMHIQFGGKYTEAFEYVRVKELDQVEDGKIELIGPEIDDAKEEAALPLGMLIEVAGRKMQKEFEPILERQVHSFLNEAMGIFHMGQRDVCWLRISKNAHKKGFKIKHFGTILHARMHDTFGAIVDKVQVTIYTKAEDVEKHITEAKQAYEGRDARMAGMTDESVDTFYSCTLCQSFAPNHICIVKPERLGLCGAYTWLDAKACFELDPTGPNQPIKKGECLDPVRGEWKNVNEFIHQKSNQSLERFHGYSVITYPETSCGCFECILAILPEANGFMIVNREYSGMTPCGMSFSTLAGTVGGGAQTPGFMGIGRLYVVSKKFISAEGGLKRVVWMPKGLKEALGERLIKRCAEEGDPDLINKIADENVATTSEELLKHLEEKGHPALTLPPLM